MNGQPWHAMDSEAVVRHWTVEPGVGLDAAEVTARRERHGPNVLPSPPHRSLVEVFARQFVSPLIYLLFLAAVIALVVGHRSDALVILIVVVVNAVIGTVQEGRAERSMESLRRLSAIHARVRRQGREEVIEARDLVPGDVLLLAAGDAVGADARLLEVASLSTAEAALTGESLPVVKEAGVLPEDAPLAERRNLVFAGTQVTGGRAAGIVVATGLKTEVGQIASLTTAAVEPSTPLEVRIQHFGRYLVGAALALFVTVMVFGFLRGLPTLEILMVAISQMVSMVPEGLPVAMTIALAVGLQRMARRGAIVRRLAAVETLGSISVICSDKTGTLTKNEMTVTALWLPGRELVVTGAGYCPDGAILEGGRELTAATDPGLRALAEGSALCNDAQALAPDGTEGRWRAVGDPTEAALVTMARKCGVEVDRLRQEWGRLGEIPFDAGTKLMVTWHRPNGGEPRVLVKGAPEVVLDLCGFERVGDRAAVMDEAARGAARTMAETFARRALRVLAVAELTGDCWTPAAGIEALRGQACFLGLIGQMDPPRDEASAAVAACRRAGIRPVMVTGDHHATGLAVARMLGIAREGDRAIDGRDLEKLPEQVLRAEIDQIAVFARVHPAQKLRIVEAYQARGEVVAMTGDGVNDAPALARADVGVAMGITGTEVAKGAAKIVITDDNFATLVRAVEGGRLVYQNLKKVILFLVATSVDEVLVLLGALVWNLPLPLEAVQILWINIVTEGVLTVNLVMEECEGDEMKRPPTPRNEPLLSRAMLGRLLLMVGTSVVSVFGYFVWRLSTGAPIEQVRSETFTVLAVCQWFNVLNCRSHLQSSLNLGLLRNGWLLGGLVLGNLLHVLVIYAPPLNHLFHTVPIPWTHFFLIGAVASPVLWLEEARKWLARRRRM